VDPQTQDNTTLADAGDAAGLQQGVHASDATLPDMEQRPVGDPATLAPDSVQRRFSLGGSAVIPTELVSGSETKMPPPLQVDAGTAPTPILSQKEVDAAARAVNSWMSSCKSNPAMRKVADDLLRVMRWTRNPELVVPQPEHWIDQAILARFVLPAPCRISHPTDQSARSTQQSVARADRVRGVSPDEAGGISEAVRSFYKATIRNLDFGKVSGRGGTARPEGDNDRLAAMLVSQISEKAKNADDLLFEMAAQLYSESNQLGGRREPLELVLAHMPAEWRLVFSQDVRYMENSVDRRHLIGFVPRKTMMVERVRPARVATEPARVPTELATGINTFTLAVKLGTDDKANSAAAQKFIKQVQAAAASTGQTEFALIDAVGLQLREACERAKTSKPLYCFASSVKGDAQALFLDVLISNDKFIKAQELVTALEPYRSKMNDAQFSEMQQKRLDAVMAIEKLPYQTRMIATNALNQQLERVAVADEAHGKAVRALKFDVLDLRKD
jgi:hypothetical protein